MVIRNTAKAVIVQDGRILLNKNRNTIGEMAFGLPDGALYYDLPGGGQYQYETLEEALRRECQEETGHTVVVDRLAAIYEEISMNERLRREFEAYAHRVFFIFICHLAETSAGSIVHKDFDMLESEWIDVDALPTIPLYPPVIHANLGRILRGEGISFLGSLHVQ